MGSNHKSRWYDKYSNLRLLLEKLKGLKKQDRDKIIMGMKNLIINMMKI